MFGMTGSEGSVDRPDEARRILLQEKLQKVNEQFHREMRARGFDPDQGDSLALTAPLAKLYSERERLREELESLSDY
jgi:hypothetical protein